MSKGKRKPSDYPWETWLRRKSLDPVQVSMIVVGDGEVRGCKQGGQPVRLLWLWGYLYSPDLGPYCSVPHSLCGMPWAARFSGLCLCTLQIPTWAYYTQQPVLNGGLCWENWKVICQKLRELTKTSCNLFTYRAGVFVCLFLLCVCVCI